VRAQITSRRRRQRERIGSEMTAWADRRIRTSDHVEIRTVVDEEVTKLAEKYRRALVLCDLEGLTHEQAAAQLRCPVGTVKSRLARARDNLRVRLNRRGFTPSAGMLTITVAPEPASAMTSDLLGSTVEGAVNMLAHRGMTDAAISLAVATLVEDTVWSMSMSTLKLCATVLVTACVIVTGAGVLAYQPPATRTAQEAIDPRTKADPGRKDYVDTPEKAYGKASFVESDAPKGSAPNQSVAALARARLQAAEKFLEGSRMYKKDRSLAISDPEFVRTPALRVLEAERDVNPSKQHEFAALQNYLKVMREVEDEERARGDKGALPIAEYYRLEAELWLAQAQVGEPRLPGGRAGSSPRPGVRPGTDPRSQALIARLEATIPMKFPNPTPLEEVLKYLHSATAGPSGEAIPIYVDPVEDFDSGNPLEGLMQTPITMDLEGVPLRRTLKLLAEQLGMGYGIKDGMVTLRHPDMRLQNWQELMVMEESFPETSPLALEVERARRGELTNSELERLDEQLKAIEEVTKRYRSIRMMMRGGIIGQPDGMTHAVPSGSSSAPAQPR
jgi:hypothetical protein